MSSRYLAESDDEGVRLEIKTDRLELWENYKAVNLSTLPEAGIIVDAGCGVGIGSEVMLDFFIKGNFPSRLYLLDLSEQRLAEAQKRLAPFLSRTEIISKKCDVVDIPMPPESADFILCRFVFEYYNSPHLYKRKVYDK